MNNNYTNELQQFEIFDILVLISLYIQIDYRNKNRKEYEYLHTHLESIENKLNILLKEKGELHEN